VRSGSSITCPPVEFVQDEMTSRTGLMGLLQNLNYKTEDVGEPAVASALSTKDLPVKDVRRVARHLVMGRDVRVWAVEVDRLDKVTSANALIQRARRFRTLSPSPKRMTLIMDK